MFAQFIWFPHFARLFTVSGPTPCAARTLPASNEHVHELCEAGPRRKNSAAVISPDMPFLSCVSMLLLSYPLCVIVICADASGKKKEPADGTDQDNKNKKGRTACVYRVTLVDSSVASPRALDVVF